ncbi:unnamed protein product [Clonostachys rhizophaga]|uniref:Cytochrome b5 heme-binding domain-containing protein n=1 Tax=Clonostachys rhizophaga TaxID=160324 RepID=A0A9N9VE43_9HYPO|nr:unnamed protein product [Clonostachys rhizophaga]
MIIHGKVYDATSYMNKHPGGSDLLVKGRVEDATEVFDHSKHSDKAKEILKALPVGTLAIPPDAATDQR